MSQERVYQVLMAPHISEKATMAADEVGHIVFRVTPNATKIEIKKAVEKLFDVQVRSVRVVNVKGKVRRTRHGLGRRSDWKKAYVRLAEGQDIDFSVVD